MKSIYKQISYPYQMLPLNSLRVPGYSISLQLLLNINILIYVCYFFIIKKNMGNTYKDKGKTIIL